VREKREIYTQRIQRDIDTERERMGMRERLREGDRKRKDQK